MKRPESNPEWSFISEKWMKKQDDALKKGYYFESIAISFNAINAILRKGIILKIDQRGNDYIDELFTDHSHPLLGQISDRSIYNEAARIGLINTASTLHSLHTRRNDLFHKLFLKDESDSGLKKLAVDYNNATTECLLQVAIHLTEKLNEAFRNRKNSKTKKFSEFIRKNEEMLSDMKARKKMIEI